MQVVDQICISPNDNLEKVISIISHGGKRIALVVDKDKKLLGTITDGDIRRALLKKLNLNVKASRVMNSQPITANQGSIFKLVKDLMIKNSLLQIPIVDSNNTLLGIETLHKDFSSKSYNNPIFIMAGGFGKRLRPLTYNIPKPLLKVGDKPILENIINNFIEYGFKNFYISLHYKGEMIREYFQDGSKWGVQISYVEESEPLGTAGALSLLPENLPNLPIIVMNADLMTKVDLEALLNFHNENTSDATVCVREYDFQVPFGVVESLDNKVMKIIEKPIQSFFVNAGVYVINREQIIASNKPTYLDMPNFLESIIKRNKKVNMFPIHEYWLDIGQKEQFHRANNEYDDMKGGPY